MSCKWHLRLNAWRVVGALSRCHARCQVKVKNGVQTGFTAKVVGALDSLINGSVVDSVIKGTLTTVGRPGRG